MVKAKYIIMPPLCPYDPGYAHGSEAVKYSSAITSSESHVLTMHIMSSC